LLEVDAHHDAQIARVLVRHRLEPPRVLDRRRRIVDRARPDDDDEPVVFAPEDAADLLAGPGHRLGPPAPPRLLLEQGERRQERGDAREARCGGAPQKAAKCTGEGPSVQRPRRVTLRPAVSRLEVLERIQQKVLWLSTYMVHHANNLRPNPENVKVGGHQASSSSVVGLLTALYFDNLRTDDLLALKAHGSPSFYA